MFPLHIIPIPYESQVTLLSVYHIFDQIGELREQLNEHWVQNLPTETLTRLADEGSVLAMEFVETPFIHAYYIERDQLVEALMALQFLVSDTARSLGECIVCLLNLFWEEVEFTEKPSPSDDFVLSISC